MNWFTELSGNAYTCSKQLSDYLCIYYFFFAMAFGRQGGGDNPIYPALQSSSSVKAEVKSQGRILVGQRSSIDFCPVYSTTDTFTDSCVNVILQKFTRNRTRVKHDFQRSRPILAWPCSLTEDEDRSTANIGVPPLGRSTSVDVFALRVQIIYCSYSWINY